MKGKGAKTNLDSTPTISLSSAYSLVIFLSLFFLGRKLSVTEFCSTYNAGFVQLIQTHAATPTTGA